MAPDQYTLSIVMSMFWMHYVLNGDTVEEANRKVETMFDMAHDVAHGRVDTPIDPAVLRAALEDTDGC